MKLSEKQLRALIIKETKKITKSDHINESHNYPTSDYSPGRWDLMINDVVKQACEEEWNDLYSSDDPSMAHAGESGWAEQVDLAVSRLDSLDNLEFSSIGEFLRAVADKVDSVENDLMMGEN